MINIKKTLMVFFALSVLASTVYADDTEIFFSTNVSKPNLLFVLDVSGSMREVVEGSAEVGDDATVQSHTVNRFVVNDNDDAEQAVAGGVMLLGDRFLDLGFDNYDLSATQRVGLRFYNMGIPKDAVITNAYIQFTTMDVDALSDNPINLHIVGEATGDAARFDLVAIDARTVTTLEADWSPPAWGNIGQRGENQRTINPVTKQGLLTDIVQNIVNRSDWNKNNGMVFIIEGTVGETANRVAVAHDAGSPDAAPTLHIEYDTTSSEDLTRLAVMQKALRRVLEVAPDNVNVGIMKYSGQTLDSHQDYDEDRRRHFISGVSFPISDINALAEPIITDFKGVDNLSNPNVTITVREFLADIADKWEPAGGTPIVDSLYEAALYFRGEKMHYGKERNNTTATTTLDGSSVQIASGSHQSTYVGGATISKTIDTDHRDNIADANYISPIESSCQSNYIVLMSDGEPTYYRAGSGTPYNKGPFARSIKGTGPSGSLSAGIPTCQNNPHTFIQPPDNFSGVSGSDSGVCGPEITEYIATHDNSSEYDGDQTIKTYTIGFGSGLSASTVDYLKSLETIDDDPSTESVVEDGYFNADSPEALAKAFRDILAQVAEPSGTLASPGYSVNVKSGLEHEKDIYIPVFDRKNSSRWSGNLKKFSIEEVGDKRLIRGKNGLNAVDESGKFTADAWDWWSDSPEGGSPDGINIQRGGAAGKLDPVDRLLVSNITGSEDLTTGSDNKLIESNGLIDNELLGITGASLDDRKKLINFIRGWENGAYDNAATPKGIARKHMGDMLHSEPLIITYDEGNAAGEGKTQYIFAGTNEGYLHAFDTATGEEIWAFMPRELLKIIEPQMRNEGTAEDHKYGIDGSLTYWENKGDGKKYLYFGLRRGGSSYYALDITNPLVPKFKWTASYPSMGQSWSTPYLGRIRDASGGSCTFGGGTIANCREVVVISGGYDEEEDRDGQSASAPKSSTDKPGADILILDAKTGALVWSLRKDLPSEKDTIVDSIPGGVRILDTNRNNLLDRFYFADTGGHVWRLDFNDLEDDSTTKLTHLANLANVPGERQSARKFYNEPDVSVMKLNGRTIFVVSIGSGFRAHPMDSTIKDKFYMLIDDKPYSAIDTSEFTTITPAKLSKIIISASVSGSTIAKTVTQVGALDSKIGDIADNNYVKGWEVTLPDNGEKVLTTALAFDGVIVFTTLIPQALLTGDGIDQCAAPSTQSHLYGINVRTGKAGLDLDGNGEVNDNDIFMSGPPGQIPEIQVLFNAFEVKDEVDAAGDLTGNSSCRHPVDIRIGKKLSQATGYDACRLESLFWSDPVSGNK